MPAITFYPMLRPMTLATLLAAALAGQALAQAADAPAATPAPAETTTEAPADATGEAPATGATSIGDVLSIGEEVGAEREAAIYIREEHGDWEIRCLEAPEGQTDPCRMFQRLEDQNGNPTVDVNIFDLPGGGEILAGATVLTPLQTLLTAQVTMTIDGSPPRRYPFWSCDQAGCYARMGFTADDLDRLRRGSKATLVVVPALAPDQEARMELSLSGFTAGYEAVAVPDAQ